MSLLFDFFKLEKLKAYLREVTSEPDNCVLCHKASATRTLHLKPTGTKGCCEECYTNLTRKKRMFKSQCVTNVLEFHKS